MTTKKRNTKLAAVEAVAGHRDLMKALMKVGETSGETSGPGSVFRRD